MINKDNIQQLTDQLQDSNSLPIEFDQVAILHESGNSEQQTLTTKILSVIGGVLGTIAFAGFLLAAGLYNSEIALAGVGLFMIAAAIILSRLDNKIIWDTFGASFLLMGFGCVTFAADGLHWNYNLVFALFIGISLVTLLLSRSYLLRFLCVPLIYANLVALFINSEIQNLYYPLVALLSIKLTLLFLYESDVLANKLLPLQFYNSVRSGLAISILTLLAIAGNNLFGYFFSGAFSWAASVVLLVLTAFTTYHIAPLLHLHKPLHRLLFGLVTVLLLLPTLYYPAISFSILLLLLSFRVRYKTGIGLSIIAFIYFISLFYYNLNYSLLHKSLILFGMGLLFLLAYLITSKKLTSSEKY